MAGQVELRRRGEDDVTVEGITGSVLFSVTADGEISDALQVDADREVARVDVVVSAAGCTPHARSEEHTSELQSLMRISYAVFCLKKKKNKDYTQNNHSS